MFALVWVARENDEVVDQGNIVVSSQQEAEDLINDLHGMTGYFDVEGEVVEYTPAVVEEDEGDLHWCDFPF